MNPAFRRILSVGVGSLLAAGGAYAQNLTPTTAEGSPALNGDTAPGERIIVTGSNIPRAADEVPPTPVVTIDRQGIENSGRGTIGEVIQRLPINTGGNTNEQFSNGFSPGASGVSLRGLGTNSTLTIINGRRTAPYALPNGGTSAFSDLNSIPQGAVERVEILKDGASAIYGADAIAGVVNVILRDDYEGAEVTTRYGNTIHKDTAQIREQLVAGLRTEKGSFLITADYFRQNEQRNADREESHNANSIDNAPSGATSTQLGALYPGYPATYPTKLTPGYNPGTPYGYDPRSSRSFPGRFTLPAALGLPQSGTVSTIPGRSGQDAANDYQRGYIPFNFNQFTTDAPQIERFGFFAKGKYNFFPWLTGYTELTYNNSKSRAQQAPTPIESNAQEALLIAADNPFNPFGVPIGFGAGNGTSFRYRGLDFGARVNRVETDFYRALVGLNFKLPLDFAFDTSALYAQSHVVNVGSNYLSNPALRAALASNNPATALNVFSGVTGANSQAVIDSIRVNTINNARADLLLFDGKLNGPIPYAKLPAGPVLVAVGGEYRNEKLNNQVDGLSNTFQIAGSGGVSTLGRRDVRAGYYEVSVPVFSPTWNFPGAYALDLIAAQRIEDYSDLGDYSAPKFSIRFQPIKDLVFRGSYSESVRAPSLSELAGEVEGFVQLSDPKQGGGGPDYQVNTLGNGNLQPEKAYALYGGFVYSPSFSFLKGLSISLDYSQIIRRRSIQTFGAPYLLANEDSFNAAGRQAVFRNADGSIDRINDVFANLGSVKARSFDFEVNYNYDTNRFGTFSLNASGSYLQSYKLIAGFGSPTDNFDKSLANTGVGLNGYDNKIVNYAGTSAFNGIALPDFKGQASLFWKYDFGTHTVPGVPAPKDGKGGGMVASKDKNVVSDQTVGIPQSVTLGVTVNYVDSYKELVLNFDDTQGTKSLNVLPGNQTFDLSNLRTVQSFTTVDLLASYTIKWATITVGVNNVADEKPPFVYGISSNTTNGYDPSQSNSLGRFYFTELRLKF